MAINNCGELLMFHCFGLRYNRHEKSWNKHQKVHATKMERDQKGGQNTKFGV